MRDKTPRFVHDDDIAPGLPRGPSSCETPSPPGFLPVAPPNGRSSCCPGNTLVCEGSFGNPQTGLRRGGKSSLLPPCVVPAEAGLCPPGKHSGSSPADTGMRSVETGSADWRHAAHLRVACSPENRSLAWPSSRYSLAWCSRYRPPSVAAFSPVAILPDPPLAVTVPCRWPPVSPPLPQSVHALHPWKSARCS